ncbi:MAG: flagellar export chaperone FliS [Alphaproteobacteria bacterium]
MNDKDFDAGTTIRSERPSQMVVMLYEEMLASLDRAVVATERGDLPTRNRHARRAADIVDLLDGCLDRSRGGEIAANLAALYRTVLGRLVQLNAGRSGRPGREAIALLEPLLDAWKAVDREEALASAA